MENHKLCGICNRYRLQLFYFILGRRCPSHDHPSEPGKKQLVNASRTGSTKEPVEPAREAVVLALHFDTVLWALHQSRKLQSDTKPDKSNSGMFPWSPSEAQGTTSETGQRCFFELSWQMAKAHIINF